MARGCSVPSVARALLRAWVSKSLIFSYRWLRRLTDLEFNHIILFKVPWLGIEVLRICPVSEQIARKSTLEAWFLWHPRE